MEGKKNIAKNKGSSVSLEQGLGASKRKKQADQSAELAVFERKMSASSQESAEKDGHGPLVKSLDSGADSTSKAAPEMDTPKWKRPDDEGRRPKWTIYDDWSIPKGNKGGMYHQLGQFPLSLSQRPGAQQRKGRGRGASRQEAGKSHEQQTSGASPPRDNSIRRRGRKLDDADLLAMALPPGWKAATDTHSGRTYYYNSETGRRRWQPPEPESGADHIPPPRARQPLSHSVLPARSPDWPPVSATGLRTATAKLSPPSDSYVSPQRYGRQGSAISRPT